MIQQAICGLITLILCTAFLCLAVDALDREAEMSRIKTAQHVARLQARGFLIAE